MKILALCLALMSACTTSFAATVNDITLKNQFGETSINQILKGGTDPFMTFTDRSSTFGPDILITKFGGTTAVNSGMIRLQRSRGTTGAASAAQSGDLLGALTFRGYGASAYQSSGSHVYAFATENYSNTANGSNLSFYTTPNTTIVPKIRMTIEQDGALKLMGSTSGYVGFISPAAPTSYQMILPSAQGTGALSNDGSGNLSFVTNPVAITCSAGAGGAATEALTCTGLEASDTILAVFQVTPGANSLPLLGYSTLDTNTITGIWSADPGAGAVVRVTVRH